MTTRTFVVSIACDNSAYDGDALAESVAQNLFHISEDILHGETCGDVRDYNGNVVGKYFFTNQ